MVSDGPDVRVSKEGIDCVHAENENLKFGLKTTYEGTFVTPEPRCRNTFCRCEINLTASARNHLRVLGLKEMGFWAEEIKCLFLKQASSLFSSF